MNICIKRFNIIGLTYVSPVYAVSKSPKVNIVLKNQKSLDMWGMNETDGSRIICSISNIYLHDKLVHPYLVDPICTFLLIFICLDFLFLIILFNSLDLYSLGFV